MKKLIAGLSLVALAVPSAQAWAVSADDIRTAHANKQRPVVRIKHEYTQVQTLKLNKYKQAVHCDCGRAAKPTGWQRSAKVSPVNPQARMSQKGQRGAFAHPLYVNNVQRVVSEKVYMQKVTRIPVASATCAEKR
jgi:hypothetical protein